MSEIKKDTRVLIKVPKEFAKECELTGRVVFSDEIECVIILDPKYQNSSWGFDATSNDVQKYSLSPESEGKRHGIMPAKQCDAMHTISKLLPETSQRRL